MLIRQTVPVSGIVNKTKSRRREGKRRSQNGSREPDLRPDEDQAGQGVGLRRATSQWRVLHAPGSQLSAKAVNDFGKSF